MFEGYEAELYNDIRDGLVGGLKEEDLSAYSQDQIDKSIDVMEAFSVTMTEFVIFASDLSDWLDRQDFNDSSTKQAIEEIEKLNEDIRKHVKSISELK